MSQKKIIAIFGATGPQGGGLARAILQDKTVSLLFAPLPGILLRINPKHSHKWVQNRLMLI